MRIGIFADLLAAPMSGMGRYVHELVRELARMPGVKLVALHRFPLKYGQEYFSESVWLPTHRHRFALISEIVFLPRIARRIKAAQLDVLHHPAQSVPIYFWFLPGKKLITIHGASEFELPKSLRPKRPIWQGFWQHTIQYKLFASNIDKFITPSAAARQNVVKHYKLPAAKIHAIPHGVDHEMFYPIPKAEAKEYVSRRFGISGEYFLHISNYQPKKNLPNQLRAFARFNAQAGNAFKFVIAGGRYWGFEEVAHQIDESGIQGSVQILPSLEGEDLRMLYAGARVFMFASFHESFGLPILEAMACGTPVITSNNYAMPEVADDVAMLVDPHKPDNIAATMIQLTRDKELYTKRQMQGVKWVENYTWANSAEKHLEMFGTCIDS